LLQYSKLTPVSGWKVFTKGHWKADTFVSSYINVPLYLLLIAGYWIVRRSPWLKPDQLDFVSNIPSDEEVQFEEPPPKNVFVKALNFLFT